MATYNTSVPATLDILDKTTPDGTEDSAKLDDAIRQLKSIVMDVILLEHNADGTHRSVAASLDSNSVTGDKIQSSATDNTKRAIATNHIQDGSVTLAKLAALAIDGSKLSANCIDNSKIADNSISGAKLQDGTVTAAKLSGSVGNAQLGNGSVDTSKITDAAVTDGKIAPGVAASKIKLSTNRIIVGDPNGAGIEAQVGGNVSIALDQSTSPPTAVFTASIAQSSLIPMFVLEEIGPAGGFVTNGWTVRPTVGGALSATFNNANLVTISNGLDIYIKLKGTYLVNGFVHMYKCGIHVARLFCPDLTSGASSVIYGGESYSDGTTPSSGVSIFSGVLPVPADGLRYQLQSWVGSGAAAATGLAPGGAYPGNVVTARLALIKIG